MSTKLSFTNNTPHASALFIKYPSDGPDLYTHESCDARYSASRPDVPTSGYYPANVTYFNAQAWNDENPSIRTVVFCKNVSGEFAFKQNATVNFWVKAGDSIIGATSYIVPVAELSAVHLRNMYSGVQTGVSKFEFTFDGKLNFNISFVDGFSNAVDMTYTDAKTGGIYHRTGAGLKTIDNSDPKIVAFKNTYIHRTMYGSTKLPVVVPDRLVESNAGPPNSNFDTFGLTFTPAALIAAGKIDDASASYDVKIPLHQNASRRYAKYLIDRHNENDAAQGFSDSSCSYIGFVHEHAPGQGYAWALDELICNDYTGCGYNESAQQYLGNDHTTYFPDTSNSIHRDFLLRRAFNSTGADFSSIYACGSRTMVAGTALSREVGYGDVNPMNARAGVVPFYPNASDYWWMVSPDESTKPWLQNNNILAGLERNGGTFEIKFQQIMWLDTTVMGITEPSVVSHHVPPAKLPEDGSKMTVRRALIYTFSIFVGILITIVLVRMIMVWFGASGAVEVDVAPPPKIVGIAEINTSASPNVTTSVYNPLGEDLFTTTTRRTTTIDATASIWG